MANFHFFANLALFIFWGIFISSLFIAVSWILNNTKRDIIETSENNLRLGLFFLTIFAQSFFVCLYAASLFFSHEYKIESYIQVFVLSLAVFPTIYLLYSYIGMRYHFKKKFKLFRAHQLVTEDEFQLLELKVKDVSEKLGLKRYPEILFSKYINISPFIFGKTAKRSYLVLPRNWEEILENVSGENEKIKVGLRNFVIRHELSHVKHKDHIFIGLSFLFLKSFKYWISVTSLFVLVYSNITGLRSVRYHSLPLLFTFFFYGIFWLLSRSLSKHREFLADARGSLLAEGKEIEIISTQEETKKSYIESFLNWFYVFSEHRTEAIGISRCPTRFSSTLGYISGLFIRLGINKKSIGKLRELFFTHPESQIRIKRINDSHFLRDQSTVISNESAIWIGIITSYFLIIPYLFSYEFFTLLQDIYNSSVFGKAGVGSFLSVFTAIYIAILIYMPLKASTASNISYKKYLFISFERIMVASATSILTHFVLAGLMKFSHPYSVKMVSWVKGTLGDALGTFQIYLPALFMISIISSVHFFALDYHSNENRIEQRKRMNQGLFLTAYIITLILVSLLSRKLSFVSIVCGLFIGGTIYTSVGIFFPASINHEKQFAFYKIPGYIKKVDGSGIILLIIGREFLPFTIFFFLGAGLAAQLHPPLIFYFLFVIYILYGILFYINIKKFRPSYEKVPLFLGNTYKQLTTLWILNPQRISEIEDVISGLISKYKLDDDSYTVHRKLKIGNIDATYYAIMSLKHAAQEDIPESIYEWLFNLECNNGGFSPMKDLKARLESTFFALDILNHFGRLNKANTELHACWIKTLQDTKGFFSDRISISSKIKQTFYALSSLNFIGKLDSINKKKCADWTMQTFLQSKRSPESFYLFLKCLDILGELNEELKREVRNEWLPSKSLTLKNSKVEANISNYYYFFKIAEFLFESDGDEIKNLIPGLDEKVYKSFVNYLEKR